MRERREKSKAERAEEKYAAEFPLFARIERQELRVQTKRMFFFNARIWEPDDRAKPLQVKPAALDVDFIDSPNALREVQA